MVNKRESIASNLSNIEHPSPNRVLDLPIQRLPGESIAASALIGQSRTHPRLNVADVPREVLTLHLTQFEFLQRPAEPVDAVTDFFSAVLQGSVFSRFEASEFVAFCDEGFGGLGVVEGEGEGCLDELVGVLLDGGGVDGEGLDAEGWVLGGAAGGLDEVGGG